MELLQALYERLPIFKAPYHLFLSKLTLGNAVMYQDAFAI